MKELMFERLRKVENLEQRQLLKDIVSGVFVNLIDYQEEMNKRLEERIFNEIDDLENKYDIYVTLCAKEDVDPIHDCLFPMFPSDLDKQPIDAATLLDSLNEHKKTVLLTLFLQCDTWQLNQLITEQRLFTGTLLTTDGSVEVKVRLQKNTMYLDEIEKLYPIFHMNGLPWKTINHPFAHKFFDVVLVECPTFNEDTEIINITIDLQEFEQMKHLNMVPLWNIQRHEVKNVGFPIPAIDKVNYEHVLSLRKMGNQHGYLIESDENNVRYVKRSDSELTVVSPQDKSGSWQLLKIAQLEKEKIGKLHYELLSNRRMDRFMHKFASKYSVNVKTKGEIIRLVNSFEIAEKLELVDIKIMEAFQGKSFSYAANPFLINMLGEHSNKKTMLLEFKAKEAKNFISNDILSFLVAEVQRQFFEYKCEGTWL